MADRKLALGKGLSALIPDAPEQPAARAPVELDIDQLQPNDYQPRADVAVCSVTFHLKSAQALGVGIRLDDVQLPIKEPVPPAEGLVGDFPRSYPKQAAAEPATARQRASCARFFMSGLYRISGAGRARRP